MSEHRELALRDGAQALITRGTADVFYSIADGQRWPLATVRGPMAVVGPASGDVALIVVGRADCVIEDVPTGASPDLTAWRNVLAMRDSTYATVAASADAISEALVPRAAKSVARAEAAQAAALQATASNEERLIDQTQARLRDGVESAGYTTQLVKEVGHSPLVKVVEILGDFQGFPVTVPRKAALQAGNPVAAIANASGVRFRAVSLADGWQNETSTALLGFLGPSPGHPSQPVALLPARRGYRIQTADDRSPRPLTAQDVAQLMPTGIQLYAPLPHDRPATQRDMAALALHRTGRLWALTIACAAFVAVLALMTPALTSSVLGMLVPSDATGAIVTVGIMLVIIAISSGLLTMVQNFATSELTQLGQLRVESALWDRTLSLPLTFFRGYSSGDLATRLTMVDQLKSLLSSQTVTAVLGAIFSVINFVLLFIYSWQLALVALVVVIAAGVAIVKLTFVIRDLTVEQLAAQRGANAWVIQLITGISKIRVAGAEDRFTALTMNVQASMIDAQSKQTVVMGKLQAFLGAIAALAPMCFFAVIALFMWGPDGATISSSTYIAFSTAFGTVLGAMVGLVAAVPAIAMIAPTMQLIQPILDSTQTQSVDAQPLDEIRGRIELRNVDFQYQPNTPAVLRNLSMVINAGELTAIVGPSGSGKTSTLRMITGIESPDAGQVLVDGHDLRDIDGDDYRRRIGTVIQGGKLTPGSIFDNIAGGARITEDDAWEAARAAAIADDIEAMPMHMQTLVNVQTISGGQAQRILIARALARHPKILLFDEATSALDNESQATVMDAMARLDVTRIVVAHRLSTVMNADRILVVAAGELVEQGTYESLIAADGLFAKLARRQLAS